MPLRLKISKSCMPPKPKISENGMALQLEISKYSFLRLCNRLTEKSMPLQDLLLAEAKANTAV